MKFNNVFPLVLVLCAYAASAQNETQNPNSTTGIFWRTTGNTNTDTANNFLGTIDNRALTFRTNNQRRVTIATNGNVGIGTTTPQYILDVNERIRLRNGALSAGCWFADNTLTDRFFVGNTDAAGNNLGIWSSGFNNWAFFVSHANGSTFQNTRYVDYAGIAGNTGFLQNQSFGEHFEVGVGTGTITNNFSYIDFHGDDALYPDYTLRLIHYNGGGNAPNELIARGTGGLLVGTQDNATLAFKTNNTTRGDFNPAGSFSVYNLGGSGVIPVFANNGGTLIKADAVSNANKVMYVQRFYCTGCDNPDRSLGVSASNYTAMLVGCYPRNGSSTDTRSVSGMVYNNNGTWYFKGDLQNPSSENWTIDVLFIRNFMINDTRPANCFDGCGTGF